MSNPDDVNRSNLPIADVQHHGLITHDAKDPATQAQWLRNGAVRQCHEVPVWQTSPAGPFSA